MFLRRRAGARFRKAEPWIEAEGEWAPELNSLALACSCSNVLNLNVGKRCSHHDCRGAHKGRHANGNDSGRTERPEPPAARLSAPVWLTVLRGRYRRDPQEALGDCGYRNAVGVYPHG